MFLDPFLLPQPEQLLLFPAGPPTSFLHSFIQAVITLSLNVDRAARLSEGTHGEGGAERGEKDTARRGFWKP